MPSVGRSLVLKVRKHLQKGPVAAVIKYPYFAHLEDCNFIFGVC